MKITNGRLEERFLPQGETKLSNSRRLRTFFAVIVTCIFTDCINTLACNQKRTRTRERACRSRIHLQREMASPFVYKINWFWLFPSVSFGLRKGIV